MCTCMCMCMCMCGVYIVLWCCVFCWWCVVRCCVILCGCGAAWHAENPPCVRSKRPPCVRSRRLHLSLFFLSVLLFFSSPLLSSPLLSSPLLSSPLLSSPLLSSLLFSSLSSPLSLFPLLSSLSSLSATMTMIIRPSRAFSQYTRPCLAFWARVHVPWHTVWRTCSHHARNNCPSIPVQASCHLNEVGLFLRGRWRGVFKV